MSSHQGMMYPWGFHGNGVPSLSSVNPMVTHPASAVNAPTAVSHSPASGSGRAPPSSTSRNGVVLANADEDDDSEESDDDDTSGSESDSEEEVEVERGDVDDFESLRSGIAGDSVMFPPALPGEEKVNHFPLDAADVFSRVARDLGITPPQAVQDPSVQGIFSAAGHSLSQPISPVLSLPAILSIQATPHICHVAFRDCPGGHLVRCVPSRGLGGSPAWFRGRASGDCLPTGCPGAPMSEVFQACIRQKT